MAVFVIVMTTVANLYLIYSRAQRVTSQRQKIVSAASFLLDQIAREIRTNEIAYWGILDYSGNGAIQYATERLYQLDVPLLDAEFDPGKCENVGGCTYFTDIYGRERELVLYNNNNTDSATDDSIIAYAFNRRDDGSTVTNLCPGNVDVGLYRFFKPKDVMSVSCERLFNMAGIAVVDAGFFYTQTTNPYPDQYDPATDIDPARSADCGLYNSSDTFNGQFCTCSDNSECWSNSCDISTGGRCTYGTNLQPAVTFFFTVQDMNNTQIRMTFQTSAVQRLYKR